MKRRAFCAAGVAALAAATLPCRRLLAATDGELAATGLDGRQLNLRPAELGELRAALRGALLTADAAGYDTARRLWNPAFDHKPALIARCAGAADVMHAVSFAAAHGLLTAVRGGGHSLSGQSGCDGGLVVDVSSMRSVRVDPLAGRARVESGVLLGEFDREAQAFGLATTAGTAADTGVAGLTLGGGVGRIGRKYGLSCDNLTAVDVVTADGRFARTSATENPDLFWALRGGGGNFGVVTSFEYRLHPVTSVLAGMVIHPLDAAPKVLAHYRDVVEEAPDALGTIVNLRLCPPVPAVPARLHGTPVLAMVVCWSGDVDDGMAQVGPLREFGRPVLDTLAPMRYVDLQHLVDATVVPGNHYYWRSADFDRLTDDVIDTVVGYASRITSPISAMPIYHLGGAVGRVPADGTAFGSRTAGHNVNMFAGWTPDDGDRDRHVAWVRDYSDAMARHATGRYVNFLSDEGADGVRDTYGADPWRRLVAVKRRLDPSNLFRYNFNIDPGRTEGAV